MQLHRHTSHTILGTKLLLPISTILPIPIGIRAAFGDITGVGAGIAARFGDPIVAEVVEIVGWGWEDRWLG